MISLSGKNVCSKKELLVMKRIYYFVNRGAGRISNVGAALKKSTFANAPPSVGA